MNNQSRKQIERLISELGALKLKLEDIQEEISSLADGEQEKFDNMSEGLQQTDRGQAIEESATSLGDARDGVESAVTSIDDAMVSLQSAQD